MCLFRQGQLALGALYVSPFWALALLSNCPFNWTHNCLFNCLFNYLLNCPFNWTLNCLFNYCLFNWLFNYLVNSAWPYGFFRGALIEKTIRVATYC
jgi:hypothetical protein